MLKLRYSEISLIWFIMVLIFSSFYIHEANASECWCFNFNIGTTTVPATVCRTTERLCRETQTRAVNVGGNVITTECHRTR